MKRPDHPPLTATYRLQLHKDFPLARAREIAPYLARLGVSHLYLSPITTARPGSTHGYDVADPTRVNPELGGDAALDALVEALRPLGLGVILDIVPNHMGIGPANPMWEDLLTRGRASPYAAWFDVDWDVPTEERGRVMLPVLADDLEKVIARDEITLERDGDRVRVRYFDHGFPADPATVAEVPDDPREWTRGDEGRERLRALLERQHWVLAFWRRASGEINYRRFFDVNELAGLRQEDPEVFRATHERILSWVADGKVQGLRVDHVDGLRQPRLYLEALRDAVRARGAGDDFPIFVEKILSPGESLRAEWATDGTTGYEFLNDLESLFVDASGAARLEEGYRRHTELPAHLDFAETARRGKKAVLHGALAADVARLTRLLAPVLRERMREAKLRRADLSAAIVALLAALPVYRTYAEGAEPRHPADRAVLERAVERARQEGEAPLPALDLVSRILLGELEPHDSRAIDFVLRFQQVSGPATAKGVEDTALYRYVPLASRNEVGSDPDRDLTSAPSLLHRANAERAAQWPRALVCTNTHDTKRSADVRARIDVLTEIPEQWASQVAAWHRLNAPLRGRSRRRRVPDTSAEWLLYQTLLGVWPATTGGSPPRDALDATRDRVQRYMEKASREAKARTSWTDPDETWEQALGEYVAALLDPARSERFIGEMSALARQVTPPATWNALSRALLHCTAPGTPDVYQGDELWNHALVDPDNRRPVDFAARERVLATLGDEGAGVDVTRAAELLAAVGDGRLKLHVMRSALRLRRERPASFARGYEPVVARGARASHLFGYVRGAPGARVVVAVPRLTVALSEGAAPVGERAWGDTEFELAAGTRWVDRLTGAEVYPKGGIVRAAALFATLPLALLVEESAVQPEG